MCFEQERVTYISRTRKSIKTLEQRDSTKHGNSTIFTFVVCRFVIAGPDMKDRVLENSARIEHFDEEQGLDNDEVKSLHPTRETKQHCEQNVFI